MAMGIVSDSEFDSELSELSITPPPIVAEVIDIKRGRNEGDNETPESLRKIIGENAVNEGRKTTQALTRALGISDASQDAYAHGATSCATYQRPDNELLEHVNKARRKIAKRARNRLNQALSEITPQKLKDAKIRDVASVAQAMSAIVKDFEPEMESKKQNTPQIVFYAPRIVNESVFEMKEVSE